MIQPVELRNDLPIKLSNDAMSTTSKLWEMLVANKNGDLEKVKDLVKECYELVYGQYNYTPPIHFAVREGHTELVKYLLGQGALDPAYKTYPFLDTLITIAEERNYIEIAKLLREYDANPEQQKFKGDNGEILYERTKEQQEFQHAVNHNEPKKAASILKDHPEIVKDQTLSWGEGILMMPANRKNKELLELLLSYGAKVPEVSKWGRAYYFKHFDIAKFLLENGMNANHLTWHHVSLLHDMAQEGHLKKAKLLVDHGADIDAIDEEYKSTPLGLASRWGQFEMVQYLLDQGADRNKSEADWSQPVEWARRRGHAKIEKLLAS